MKYGIAKNLKNNEIIIESAKEFKNDHWDNIQRMKDSGWVSFPKKKVFISFCENDRKMMINLKTALKKSELLTPIVIEDKREGAKNLPDLIINGINDSDFYVLILSSISIKNQWVNQELGYAFSREKELEIVPIVESIVIHDLKGFINRNNQLSYQFKIVGNERKDRESYREAYKSVISYMESCVLKNIERVKE